MKKLLVLLTTLVLLAAVMTGCGGDSTTPSSSEPDAAPASAPEPQDDDETPEQSAGHTVDIANGTGVDIMELYITQSGASDEGEDLLAGSVFAADGTVPFTVNAGETTFDIRILDEDGDVASFAGIDLSGATAVVLHWGSDGQTFTASISDGEGAERFSQDVDIINSTGVAIMELYVSPSDQVDWGPDLLAGQTLAADESFEFVTDVTGTANFTWDIRIVDEDGDDVVFEDLSFSSSYTVTLHWGADGQTPTATLD